MVEQNTNDGSSFDDFLRDEDIYEEVAGIAAARVLAWQLQQQMNEQGISKQDDNAYNLRHRT